MMRKMRSDEGFKSVTFDVSLNVTFFSGKDDLIYPEGCSEIRRI